MFRLLHTVLFQKDSVFDETIDLYQWIKPWKSYIIVAKMQKKYELVYNSVQSSDLLYYTNGSYRAFC